MLIEFAIYTAIMLASFHYNNESSTSSVVVRLVVLTCISVECNDFTTIFHQRSREGKAARINLGDTMM